MFRKNPESNIKCIINLYKKSELNTFGLDFRLSINFAQNQSQHKNTIALQLTQTMY